ncbi:unnamed protein product [Schistosoma margrebowiei]|uniref:Uncharacterized protein n=1 Tax=Schistosoma margrebowiei TaxID=48269 RepID=A0A183M9D8_9TREM|nr:unnamed protein product [Schistosoma margrebowiei]
MLGHSPTTFKLVSASVGLNIHKGKTMVLKFRAENSNPITVDGETLEDVESFTYLESIIDEQGGNDWQSKGRISTVEKPGTQNNCQPISK